MTPTTRYLLVLVAGLGSLVGPYGHPAGGVTASLDRSPNSGGYAWPLQGPVIHEFEEPPGPYGSGHRGIDIAAPIGTQVAASQDGTVAFAGWVGGSLFASVDHADGIRTTYSWLSAVLVKKGEVVARGQPIARSGHGHPDVDQPHLHFGARIGSTYIDPMILLEPGTVVGIIHLAPLEEERMHPWWRPDRADRGAPVRRSVPSLDGAWPDGLRERGFPAWLDTWLGGWLGARPGPTPGNPRAGSSPTARAPP